MDALTRTFEKVQVCCLQVQDFSASAASRGRQLVRGFRGRVGVAGASSLSSPEPLQALSGHQRRQHCGRGSRPHETRPPTHPGSPGSPSPGPDPRLSCTGAACQGARALQPPPSPAPPNPAPAAPAALGAYLPPGRASASPTAAAASWSRRGVPRQRALRRRRQPRGADTGAGAGRASARAHGLGVQGWRRRARSSRPPSVPGSLGGSVSPSAAAPAPDQAGQPRAALSSLGLLSAPGARPGNKGSAGRRGSAPPAPPSGEWEAGLTVFGGRPELPRPGGAPVCWPAGGWDRVLPSPAPLQKKTTLGLLRHSLGTSLPLDTPLPELMPLAIPAPQISIPIFCVSGVNNNQVVIENPVSGALR